MWLVYAVVSMLFFGVLYLVQRSIAVDSKNYQASSLAFNLASALIAIFIYFFRGGVAAFTLPQDPQAYIFASIAIIFYGLFERLRFKAAGGVEASENAILGNLAFVVGFVISFFLYQEQLTLLKIVGAFLVLCGLLIVSWQPNLKLISRGSLLVIFNQILLGIALSLDKMGSRYFKPEFYGIIIWIIPLFIIALPRFPLSAVRSEFKTQSKSLWLMAFLNVAGYYSLLQAYLTAEAVRVIPIVQSSSLISVVLAVFILKERDRLPQKIFASLLAIAGVYLLSA